MGIALCAYGFLYLRFMWHNQVPCSDFSVESRKALNICIFNDVRLSDNAESSSIERTKSNVQTLSQLCLFIGLDDICLVGISSAGL
jgi:hypothetical protein